MIGPTPRFVLALAMMWALAGGAARALPAMPETQLHLVGPQGAPGEALRRALLADLERTPRRHQLVLSETSPLEVDPPARVLALFELRFDAAVERPTLDLAQVAGLSTPGWLVHAVLRAAATVGLESDVGDRRSSWLGQLVARATTSPRAGAADQALGRGVPAVVVRLPAADPAGAARLLAATVRRLDGLDGAPVFEDQFLVVAGRVLLRRDLYWLGLLLWLGLFFRGRRRPGREFRWLLLVAWLVAPVQASLLLAAPALAAIGWPARGANTANVSPRHWIAALALVPSLIFAVRLALALAGPAVPASVGLPALLVGLALAAFAWSHLLGRRGLWPSAGPGASATSSAPE